MMLPVFSFVRASTLLSFSGLLLVASSEDSSVTNPYYSGCLRQKSLNHTQLRVCNSEDHPSSLEGGLCRPPNFDSYMEIRLNPGDWDSPIIAVWLVQIILSEILGVPTTVETGGYGTSQDFYHPQSSIDYVATSNSLYLGQASDYEHGDCRLAPKDSEESYTACAHFIPEHWHAEHADVLGMLKKKLIDPPQNIGSLGMETWFIPKFAVERDPSLASYIGLQGDEQRQKMAETFQHPATWQEYCEIISSTNCTEPDDVAERPPEDESEGEKYFKAGVYTGHFRMLEENNCTKYPTTCQGHIADYPCGWVSYMGSQLHHLDIALDKQRYGYSRAIELYHAANATKSSLMMMWWTPEPLYQQYLGSNAEMMQVALPPQTQACVEARPVDECSEDLLERVGPPEAACSQAPRPLAKFLSSTLQDAKFSHLPDAVLSPAYAMLQSFQLREVQLNELFGLWNSEESPREAVCRWASENMDLLNLNVPPTYPRVSKSDDASAFSYITMVIAACCAVMVTLTVVAVYKCQSRGAIRYAQVEFLWLLLAGSFLITIGAILSSVPASDATCTAAVWFINIGYTLELVPLIVKVAAINTMMANARRMRRVTLERNHLHGAVAIILVIVTIFLIAWTVVDPPHKDTEYSLTKEATEDGDQIVALTHFCEDSDSNGWKFAAVAWNGTLLVVASVLAFQTRNIIKTFNESQTLAILIYSHLIFVILRFVTYFLEDDIEGATLNYVRSLLYSVDTLATVIIYFVPKFFAQDDALVGQSTVMGVSVSGLSPSTHNFVPNSQHLADVSSRLRCSGVEPSSRNSVSFGDHLSTEMSVPKEESAVEAQRNDSDKESRTEQVQDK